MVVLWLALGAHYSRRFARDCLRLGSLSPLPSFPGSGRTCSAVVMRLPAYPVQIGAVYLRGFVYARSAVFCLVGAELSGYADETP